MNASGTATPVSALELFRVGLGPSSSHTVAPMRAAMSVAQDPKVGQITQLDVELYGSLALTGTGHGTPRAIVAGLRGWDPSTADVDEVLGLDPAPVEVRLGSGPVGFRLSAAPVVLPGHPNALRFTGSDAAGVVFKRVFRSIGGGFLTEDGVDTPAPSRPPAPASFATAAELTALAERHGGLAQVVALNESASAQDTLRPALRAIVVAMEDCMDRGLAVEGVLPGGLGVRRRARALAASLTTSPGGPTTATQWACTWAIAVNEENAAGRRVVTAPTNGAAGVVPAVLRYATVFEGVDREGVIDMLLTATAIGTLVKHNASISGADMGCQGEVGTASAMAAAALAEALGGSPSQTVNAAEIALEHHLGMTCDPIAGLVQIPCIERNALGAVKAITAAHLALGGTGDQRVSLDEAITAMRRTGEAMHSDYKETSLGGLAVSVVQC